MHQDLQDRLGRAKFWVDVAREREGHEAFVFLFMALNAMYGRRQYDGRRTEVRQDIERFLTNLWAMHKADQGSNGSILTSALDACQLSCEALLLDPFVDDNYWSQKIEYRHWVKNANAQLAEVKGLRRNERHERFIKLVLERLAVLRNQVMHGCVTYGEESKGWASLDTGLNIMRSLVPAFYELMKRHGHHCVWDSIPYPRLGSDRHPKRGHLK